MTTKGGSETKGGFYWKTGAWEIVTVEGNRGALPGGEYDSYLRIPGLLVIPLALAVSLSYVIFLPVIGFAMLFRTLGSRLAASLGISATKTLREAKQTVPAHKAR